MESKKGIQVGLVILMLAQFGARASFMSSFSDQAHYVANQSQNMVEKHGAFALTAAAGVATWSYFIYKLRAVKKNVCVVPPIFYRPEYNISLFGSWIDSKIHPFNGCKYADVASYLKEMFVIPAFCVSNKVSKQDLKKVHSDDYLDPLDNDSDAMLAPVIEVQGLSSFHWVDDLEPGNYKDSWTRALASPLKKWLLSGLLKNRIVSSVVSKRLLDPMRYATQGTVEAARAALQHGWAINLSGGYHHAKSNKGEGFCIFADIPLAIVELHETRPGLKVLIVDLDAHLGNGPAGINSFNEAMRGSAATGQLTYIFDMYSKYNYPGENNVQHVDFPHGLKTGITTEEYLSILRKELPKAIEQVKPDLVIYNAGTDIYAKDPLGKMSVSEDGIVERDDFVFAQCAQRKIPIVMTLSGGYTRASAGIIGRSIENIFTRLGDQFPLMPRLKSKYHKELMELSS